MSTLHNNLKYAKITQALSYFNKMIRYAYIVHYDPKILSWQLNYIAVTNHG